MPTIEIKTNEHTVIIEEDTSVLVVNDTVVNVIEVSTPVIGPDLSDYARLDGINTPTTGPWTFGEQTIFNERPRFNEDLELELGTNIRAQVTPNGPFVPVVSVGNGFVSFGISNFSNNILGKGLTFQSISSITAGAFQILRSVEGLTLNTRVAFIIGLRVDNKLVNSVDDHGFNYFKGETSEITTVNTPTYTVLPTDRHLSVTQTTTGACTITLPSITRNQYIRIKDAGYNAGTNTITINANASDTVENGTSITITSNGGYINLQANLLTNNWEQI